MTTMSEAIVGIAYFFSVFAKAFQQRNVAFVNYKALIPMSYVLAIADVTVFGLIALKVTEVDSMMDMALMAFCIGTGGATGSVCATYIHHKYFTKKRFQ